VPVNPLLTTTRLGVVVLVLLWVLPTVGLAQNTERVEPPRPPSSATPSATPSAAPERERSGDRVRASDPDRSTSGQPASAPPDAAPSDAAPSIVDRYQRIRLQMLADRWADDAQGRVSVLPARRVSVASDSLRPASASTVTDEPPEEFPVASVRSLRKLERGWFRDTFGDTRWSFLGAGRYMTPLDTTRTRELRARLQAQFGDPTQTLGDVDLRKPRSEYVQFEYWLVVNDSIPVVVTDANGALDRGLIVSVPAQHRDNLRVLRHAVLAPMMEERELQPYVDYYFETQTRRWYRTGYDGDSYFLDRVYRYEMTPGRRPRLDADDRPPPSSSEVPRSRSSSPASPSSTP